MIYTSRKPPKKLRILLVFALTCMMFYSTVAFAVPTVSSQTYYTTNSVASFKIIINTSPPAGVQFGIWIFAVDSPGNDVTSFTGTVHITVTYSGGVISRTSGSFKGGQWWEVITIDTMGSATVLIDDGNGHTGSRQTNVQAPPTPSPKPTPTPSPFPTSTATSIPTPTQTPAQNPNPLLLNALIVSSIVMIVAIIMALRAHFKRKSKG